MITVRDVNIRTIQKDGKDYISLTDIAKQKNVTDPNGVIGNWMRNGVKPIQTSKATFAIMPPSTSSSALRIWRTSILSSSTMVCHKANDSSNSIRLPFTRCKYWKITRAGSC